jgi:ribosome-associated protein
MTFQPIEFELEADYIELNQLLKLTGLCDSGGAGKQLVASGAVSVDGITELRKTRKIRANTHILVNGQAIQVVGAAATE